MVWIIQPMERKDPETKQGSGKWDLVARSDEDGKVFGRPAKESELFIEES